MSENGPLWIAVAVWLLAVASLAFVAGLMCAMDHLVYITQVV
jgi:hypothetical protein